MQFISFEYLLFLPVAFVTYWQMPSQKLRNLVLLIASVVFYSFADLKMLFLLLAVCFMSYYVGKAITEKVKAGATKTARNYVVFAITVDVLVLGIFKYFNFFTTGFADLLSHFGLHVDAFTLKIILPLGLSFYIFMAISYVVDCYRYKIDLNPTFLEFLTYFTFFPHLVAGPIDRGRLIIPQLQSKSSFTFEQGSDGLRQILWGLFKKAVVADTCSQVVDYVWAGMGSMSTTALIIAMILYSAQIYCDFSGYSDMAIGTGKLFGIQMMKNFDYPYFSRNISEFWRKWHMSLTSWFTEYIYIPLGGNRISRGRTILNTVFVFTLCGLWHGANMTFVIWGFLNGLLFIPLLLQKNPKKYKNVAVDYKPMTLFKVLVTFILVTICWVFFRASSINEAFAFFNQLIFSNVSFSKIPLLKFSILFVFVTLFIEWFQRNKEYGLVGIDKLYKPIRWLIYLGFIFVIIQFSLAEGSFIYQNF